MSKITFFRKVSKILLLSVVTISLCSTLFIQPVNAIYATDINVADLHLLANQEREKAGLASLTLNEQLNEAARNKANHMIANNYWDHYAPDGTTPWSFIKASGYDYKTAGENLAEGFSYSSDVVAGWMNSTTHKANVLKDSYADVGYAVLNGVLLGEKTTLVVAMYGTPKSYYVSPQAKTSGSSVAVSMTVDETDENSGAMVNSNGSVDGITVDTKKPGLVKGLMASLPVSVYVSTSKDMKLFIMTIGIIILLISIRFLLFSICNRRGVHYIWFRKRPVFGSMLLFVSFVIAMASSLGFAFL
jgi:hypothetical protein